MKSKSFSGSFPSSSVHCAMSTAALLLVLSADLFQIGEFYNFGGFSSQAFETFCQDFSVEVAILFV